MPTELQVEIFPESLNSILAVDPPKLDIQKQLRIESVYEGSAFLALIQYCHLKSS